MDSENNIDNYALYIFLFLSLLSVGNDFYHVYVNALENDVVKSKLNKLNDYYNLFQNVMCNNVKKIKNKIVLDKKEVKKNKEETNKKNRIKINKHSNNNDQEINKVKKDNKETTVILDLNTETDKTETKKNEKKENIVKNITKNITKKKDRNKKIEENSSKSEN